MSFDEIKSNNLIHLPTVIDLESYPNVKRNFKTEKVTIVWIGTPSTVKYLSLIIPVLERLNKKYPIKFKVIGAKIPVKNLEIDLVNWNAETEADELISSDIE
jgi:glycosyltransferase involved in cell wall biosynthesis